MTKKIRKYYIALVLEKLQRNKEYSVKYLKKIGEKNFKIELAFPDIDDISTISQQEILQLLPQPQISRRHNYIYSSQKLKFQIE